MPPRVAGVYLAVVLVSTCLMFLGVVLSLVGVSAAVYVTLYLAGAAGLIVSVVSMRRYRRKRPPS